MAIAFRRLEKLSRKDRYNDTNNEPWDQHIYESDGEEEYVLPPPKPAPVVVEEPVATPVAEEPKKKAVPRKVKPKE